MKTIRIFLFALLCLSLTITKAQDTGKKTRLKVGLVLGGGGAKGASEVGILKYIEQSGIPIDYIAGTSIGSIVGGLYACGHRSAELDSMFRSQKWATLLGDRDDNLKGTILKKKNGVVYMFGFPVGRKNSSLSDSSVGVIRGDNIIHLLDSLTNRHDSISFDSLPIPFRCVATDYKHHREVVLSSGWLPQSMRASMAIPGAFKAVEIDSIALLDGGLINNLPVDVVRAMGADVVIAIDLTQNRHKVEKQKKAPKFLRKAKTNLGQLTMWAITRPDMIKYEHNRQDADVYINPPLKGYGAGSFSRKSIQKMIEIGYETGKEALDQLIALKKTIMFETE